MKVNLPVYVIPETMKDQLMTTKAVSSKGVVVDIPDHYRLLKQDIYPEEVKFLKKQRVRHKKIMSFLKQ